MTWTLPGAILFLLGLMLLLGYFLSRKVFGGSDETAERPAAPGPDCDSCGVQGCGGFAKALVRGGEAPEACGGASVGGRCDAARRLAKETSRRALVRCVGRDVPARYRYTGAPSCRAAVGLPARPRVCDHACLGYGDCVPSCKARAIRVTDGIAFVDPERCNGCGDCVSACPLGLIQLRPEGTSLAIACLGARGAPADWTCPNGCTACGACVEACPEEALVLEGNGPPDWLRERCTACGACVPACPQGVVLLSGEAAGDDPPARVKAHAAAGLALLVSLVLVLPCAAQPLTTLQEGLWLRDVTLDARGGVWASLDREGVLYLDPGADPVDPAGDRWVRIRSTEGGLPNDDVQAILPEGDRGVWLGSLVGGLAYLDHGGTPLDLSDDRWAHFTAASTAGGLTDPFVYSIVSGPDGLKWIGTQKGGMSCLDDGGTPLATSDDRWAVFRPGNRAVPPWIYVLVPDGPTALWVATWGDGLYHFDHGGTPFDEADDRWVRFSPDDGLPGNKVRAVAEDPAGGIWIGVLGGLAYLDTGGTLAARQDDRWAVFTPRDGLPGKNVMDVTVTPDGAKWVALWGGGLARLDDGGTPLVKSDDRWTVFGVEEGLTELIVRRLHPDPRGHLWLATWGNGLMLR